MLESLFNKVAGLDLQLYQKENPLLLFFCEYCEILRMEIISMFLAKNTYFEEHLRMAALDRLLNSNLHSGHLVNQDDTELPSNRLV